MITIDEMEKIVNTISYKPGWFINFHYDGRPYIQISATTLDSITLTPSSWKSGKTYLSQHMCKQEIVSAVYGAIEKAELHEVREFFRYKNVSIFNPHLDPDALVEIAKYKKNFCIRDNAMTMVET